MGFTSSEFLEEAIKNIASTPQGRMYLKSIMFDAEQADKHNTRMGFNHNHQKMKKQYEQQNKSHPCTDREHKKYGKYYGCLRNG